MTGLVLAAEPPSSDYTLQLARVDLLIRNRQFRQAADELGQISKEYQQDPLFQKYTQRVVAALYGPKAAPGAGGPSAKDIRLRERLRVVQHKRDAGSASDRSFDKDGIQVNQHLEGDMPAYKNYRARLVTDFDGFKNGHRDVRYRTLLADVYDGPTHLAVGDSATYTSPYFLRGSRLRGANFILAGELNEFQAVIGGYPFYLEAEDEYIYPRAVLGARDRWKIFDDRIRLGVNYVQTRDDHNVQVIDPANRIRENHVYSLDQEIKLIPDTWYLKAAQAYSYTDEDLEENPRTGENTKLKDTSFRVEQLLIQPWARLTSRFERTGPEFRLLTDLPSGGVLNVKGITADRQLVENFLDLEPFGPFDADLQASFIRNNLDNDDIVEQTRQAWYTANVGIQTPKGWPRPRVRASLVDTVSVPGASLGGRPSQSRLYTVRPELSHFHYGMNFTEFIEYKLDEPAEDRDIFSAEEEWAAGARMATTLLDRVMVSPHYTYRVKDQYEYTFADNQLRRPPVKSVNHEAGLSTSTRVWSNASVGLGYTFLHGKLLDTRGSGRIVPVEGHSVDASFTWPFTKHTWNKRRKLTLFPGLYGHITDLAGRASRRPSLSGQLSLAYEQMQDWKAELRGEFLVDKEDEADIGEIRTRDNRLWLLWTAQWK